MCAVREGKRDSMCVCCEEGGEGWVTGDRVRESALNSAR